MPTALILCLFVAPLVVEENFDFAVVMTHTFERPPDMYTVSHLIFRRGQGHYIGIANYEPAKAQWNQEPGGLVCRFYDRLDKCDRVCHVKALREVVLDREFDARGIPWLDMKKPN